MIDSSKQSQIKRLISRNDVLKVKASMLNNIANCSLMKIYSIFFGNNPITGEDTSILAFQVSNYIQISFYTLQRWRN